MITIYCIEDINDLKYVGSTKQKLNQRLKGHKHDKKNNRNTCSSEIMDLDNCKIYEIEKCSIEDRYEREKYWINEIDCINKIKYLGRPVSLHKYNISDKRKIVEKRYKEKHKEKIREKRNTPEYKEKSKIYKKQLWEFKNSMGSNHFGSLLHIDVCLFQ